MNSSISITQRGHVYTVEMRRPPENFIDEPLADEIATALESLDSEPDCRCVVLVSEGKHFCAGANLAGRLEKGVVSTKHIYDHVGRMLQTRKPLIAAVQGAAVGAGLGLALLADFRVASPQARFSANFTRQGYHPGFGLTFTLPRVLGVQRATWMFYSGARVTGEEALRLGLADSLVPLEELRVKAMEMADEISQSGPLAIEETRASLRGDFSQRFMDALSKERAVQKTLQETDDYREGVMAMKERRQPLFQRR